MNTIVDVLAVMANAIETYTRLNREAMSEEDHILDIEDAQAALAALAELIEAVEDEKYKSGPQFTCEEWLESSRRVRNALARVKGA